LGIVQYINPNTLRKFIGLGEESYRRSKHIYFVYHRLRYEEAPLYKRSENVNENIGLKGNLVKFSDIQDFTFKHEVWDEVFEIKVKYNGYLSRNLFIMAVLSQHSLSIFFEPFVENEGHHSNSLIPPISEKEYQIRDGDVSTIVLNMLSKTRTLSYAINDVTSRHIVTDIPRRRYQLKIFGDYMSLTFISVKHLRSLSIQLNENSMFWDYDFFNYKENCNILKSKYPLYKNPYKKY
jgi:hypothetical protein